MSVSEKQKQHARAWDLEHMKTLSCRVREADAKIFKKYCAEKKLALGNCLRIM